MTKKLFYIIPFVIVALVVVFWEPIAGTIIKTCVNSYCRHHFGNELQTERIYKDRGFWTFDKPVINHNGAQLTADRVLFRLGIKPFERTLELDVVVEDSRIDLREEITSLEDVIYDIISKTFPYWLFKVHTSFTIQDGKVSWYENDGKILTSYEADFSFSAVSETEKMLAKISLFLDGKDKQSNSFEFKINKEDGLPLNAELIFQNVGCKKIAHIYQALGHPYHGWEIYDGIIDGNIHFHHPENKRNYVWGEATLNGLAFGNPSLEITGSIPEAVVDLETKVGEKEIPRILGRVSLDKAASLAISKDGVPFWELKNFMGELAFLPDEGITVAFGGQCQHENHSFGLSIKGDACVYDETQAAIELTCLLSNPHKEDAKLHAVVRQLGDLYNSAELQLSNIGKEEFEFIQTALAPYIAGFQSVRMQDGRINAEGIAYMQDFKVTDIKIDEIVGKQLLFNYEPLDMSVSTDKAFGDFSVNLTADDLLETIAANFALDNGNVKLLGVNGNTWRFDGIKTVIAVRKGVLQKSEMHGHFEGLEGALTVDWSSPEEFLKINFSGPARKLSSFMPVAFTRGIEKVFSEEQVNVVGGMAWQGVGARFEGKLIFSDAPKAERDTIAFGFDLEKCSEKFWKKWPADELAVSYWENAGLEAMQKVMPPIVSPLILFETNWIKAESGIAGLVVRKGWFQAGNLSLEKYLTPFVLADGQMTLKGLGNFKGVFDHKCFAVEYDAKDVLLENQFLALKAKKIQPKKDGGEGAGNCAVHYFDFDKGIHFGSIPLKKASYHEKNSGLMFNDVDTLVILEGDKIHFTDLKTRCEGMELEGGIDLAFDRPNDGVFTMDIKVNRFAGSVIQVKNLLERYNPELSILDFPVDGDVSLIKDGALLSFAFEPGNFFFDAKVHGMVSGAHTDWENSSAAIKNTKFNFFYDHNRKSLDITNIYGEVFVGEPPQVEQYTLSGDYIRFSDYENHKAEFDVWVGDQNRDIIRLVGKTLPEASEAGSHKVSFHINHELTHFGDAHPSNFQLVVKDWTQVENFSLGLNIRLNTLFHDLQRFGNSEILPVPKSLGKALNNVKAASGAVAVFLKYDGVTGDFSYNFNGKDVAVSDYAFHDCLIKGRKSGEYWCVDSLKFDDLSLSAYLKNNNNSWSFNQLEFRYGDAVAMELDGDYHPQDNTVKAHVANLQMQFEGVKNCGPLIDSFLESCSPHGKMIASGELQLDFSQKTPGCRAEAILDAKLSSWDMKGLHFQDVQNVSCHFVSDKGITLRNLSTNIITPDTRSTRAQISFEKASYEFLNGEMSFDTLEFQVPAHHLPWFAEAMEKSFPALVTPASAEVLKNCKLQGTLEGVMQYEFNPPYTAAQLRLKDGKYLFLNSEHELRNFVMEYDPFEFKVVSKYIMGGDYVWLYGRSTSPNLSNGELVFTDLAPEQQNAYNDYQALFIHWENDPFHGFSVKNAEGNLFGITYQLQQDPTEPLSDKAIYLVGQVEINSQKAKSIFPEEISKKIVDLKIGDGYKLRGKWRLQKDGVQDYANKLHFLGIFEGESFAIKGYQFDSMGAHLEYTPSTIRLRDLSVNDASGTLSADRIELVKGNDGHWYFSMPEMHVENFRPSILCEEGMYRPHSRKPLVIRDMVLEGCQGRLDDSASIIGKGALRFTNRSKNRLQNTIFHIPSEILSRIGLDLSVLTPVTGTIEYKIQNGNVYLTKFKDVYSESKLSKFYLSSSSYSTVDFEGNLDVQVRMKQHNIIFKLAELFTVNIGGSLQKPTYSLQKQKSDDVALQR